MHILITNAILGFLTIAMILLGILWERVPQQLKSFIIRVSIVAISVYALFAATKWGTASDRLNVLLNWLAIAGYEFLVVLFARLPPRWLTIPSAIILLIPLFASSIVFPLAELFEPVSEYTPMGNHLFYEVNPWVNTGGGNAGADIRIFYRPPFAPFLRHKVQTITFNNEECNSYAAFAIPGPTSKTVLGRCPHWPSGPPGTFDQLSPLP
jgi:hypothetical protein